MLSFFFLMQLDEQMLSSDDVTGLVKNALSLCVRFAPFTTNISRSRYCCRCRICNLTMIFFSSKIEQSSVLIDNVYR